MTFPVETLSPMQKGKLDIFRAHSDGFACYGFAISSFSALETAFLAAYLHFSDEETDAAISSYWQINSVRARYEWINKRVNNSPENSALTQSWRAIRSRLDRAIEKRNSLAHGEFAPIWVSSQQAIIGWWPRLPKAVTTNTLSYNATEKKIDGLECVPPDELLELGLEFIDICEEVFGMFRRAKATSNQRALS